MFTPKFLKQAASASRHMARVQRLQAVAPAGVRRVFSSEVDLLQQLLKAAEARDQETAAPEPDAVGPKFNIATFNAISPVGLKKFSKRYDVNAMADVPDEAHAILLRSHKLQSSEVPATVRAIARCGAGTNNIPVEEMTARGIPVFNTPGANANAVKELVICALFLASRGIVEGIRHMDTIFDEGGEDHAGIKKRVEADKKFFVGQELKGKKLGVIGLGHIGASVAHAAHELGMDVIGFDPAISLEAAWRLPNQIQRAHSIDELLEESDYITLHVPYIKDKTHHLLNGMALARMKKNAHIVNFARAELIDSEALGARYESGEHTGKYIADFADTALYGQDKVILIPHLGASTGEAEENSAAMAADEIMEFIETGSIRNAVNFPTCTLPTRVDTGVRLCIVNQNVPGALGSITTKLGEYGLNITQQINTSAGNIAYNVVDIESFPDNIDEIQAGISSLEGVLSSRAIDPTLQVGMFHVTDE